MGGGRGSGKGQRKATLTRRSSSHGAGRTAHVRGYHDEARQGWSDEGQQKGEGCSGEALLTVYAPWVAERRGRRKMFRGFQVSRRHQRGPRPAKHATAADRAKAIKYWQLHGGDANQDNEGNKVERYDKEKNPELYFEVSCPRSYLPPPAPMGPRFRNLLPFLVCWSG